MEDEKNESTITMGEDGHFELSQEMHELFAEVARQQDEQFWLCKTMLAEFKATGETDIRYMDGYMDCLYDFMEQGSDTENVYLEYIAHIASFDPQEAVERRDDLEDWLGYKTEVAYAAAFVARQICRERLGSDDFFKAQCWRVGCHGHDWKIMTVGFLYHVVENLGCDVSEVLQQTKKKLTEWMSEPENDFWKYDFDDELMPFPGEICHPPTDAEWAELADALCVLNEMTAPDKQSYLARFKNKYLPIKVKIDDLEGLPSREEEYQQFLQMLWNYADERGWNQKKTNC